MGRLEDIIERNKNPRRALRKSKGRRGVGIAGVVLFIVLIAVIFTNLAMPPEDDPAPAPRDRVRDVYLAKPPK